MTKIICPKCGKEVELNVVNSVSEDGEVFRCPHCNWLIRFTNK